MVSSAKRFNVSQFAGCFSLRVILVGDWGFLDGEGLVGKGWCWGEDCLLGEGDLIGEGNLFGERDLVGEARSEFGEEGNQLKNL